MGTRARPRGNAGVGARPKGSPGCRSPPPWGRSLRFGRREVGKVGTGVAAVVPTTPPDESEHDGRSSGRVVKIWS